MKNIIALAIALSALAPVPASATELAAQVSADALTITSMPRGGTAVLLGVARVPSYYMSRIVVSRELIVDADRNGTERYEPAGGVPAGSVWILVDLATGETLVVTPEGTPAMTMKPRGAGRGKALEALAASIDVGRTAIDLLVVRPGAGAWQTTARDGGAGDRDGRLNGRLRLDPSSLRPVGATTGRAPHPLQNGDVIVAADVETLEYLTMTIGRGGQ